MDYVLGIAQDLYPVVKNQTITIPNYEINNYPQISTEKIRELIGNGITDNSVIIKIQENIGKNFYTVYGEISITEKYIFFTCNCSHTSRLTKNADKE